MTFAPAFMVGRPSYKLHILEWRVSKTFNSDSSGKGDTHSNRQLDYKITLNLEFSVCMLVYKVRQMVNRSPHTTCYIIDPWIRWGWEASTTNLDRNDEHLLGKNHSQHWGVVSKGLPRQAEVAQGVPGRLRPRIFLTFRHYKGGRSPAKCTGRLYLRRNPWYSLSEAESTSGHHGKNPQWHTTGNRSWDRPTSSAVP